MAKRFLFTLASLAMVAMICEGLARVALPFVEHGADDASHRRLWVAEHSDTREIYYEFDAFDPILGWRSKPKLRDRVVFGDKTLNTNSLGLRGRREYDILKQPGSTRILVLGDSFTFGDEVSDNETFSHYLGELLPNAEVMNFGMHGYGHDQMLLLYREVGRQFRPDVVVLGFVYSDIYRNLLSFRDYSKPRFVADGKGLRLDNSPVPTPEETLAREPLRSKLWDALQLARTLVATRGGRLEGRARALSLRILDALLEETRADGAVPVFLYLPIGLEVEGLEVEGLEVEAREIEALAVEPEALKRSERLREREAFLLDHCTVREVPCASARGEFSAAAARGVRFSTGLHWGPAGHRASAAALAKLLRSAGLAKPVQRDP